MPEPDEDFFVCEGCGISTQNPKRHKERCKKKPASGQVSLRGMTGKDVLQQLLQLGDVEKDNPFIRVYTLESPMCYTGNRACRTIGYDGLDPKFDKMWKRFRPYEYGLQKEVLRLDALNCLCFRAVNFQMKWAVGYCATWPQISSASRNPQVVRAFLGGGADGPNGTICTIYGSTCRSIEKFSKAKFEQEVVFLINTQFRQQASVGSGMKRLMSVALRISLQHVTLLELAEVQLRVWGDVLNVLTPEEKIRNHEVVAMIENIRPEPSDKARDPVTGDDVPGKPMSQMPKPEKGCPYDQTGDSGRTLLMAACTIPNNHAAVHVLLHRRPPVDTQDTRKEENQTALGYAAIAHDVACINALLRCGAKPKFKGKSQKSGCFLPDGIDFRFEGLDLKKAKFDTIKLPAGVDFRGVILDGADFGFADMTQGVQFEGASLKGVTFDYAKLPARVDFRGHNLEGCKTSYGKSAKFICTDLSQGVQFEGASLKGVDFSGTKITAEVKAYLEDKKVRNLECAKVGPEEWK